MATNALPGGWGTLTNLEFVQFLKSSQDRLVEISFGALIPQAADYRADRLVFDLANQIGDLLRRRRARVNGRAGAKDHKKAWSLSLASHVALSLIVLRSDYSARANDLVRLRICHVGTRIPQGMILYSI